MPKKKKRRKFSKNLTPEQVEHYKRIGEPDMSQNWLELFTDIKVKDLFTIIRSCSNNQQKAEYIEEELKDLGFNVVGEGTNVLVMENPVYPGVVFKIALDDNGIADNFNDCILQTCIPRYVPVYARHPTSIVSVQPRGVLPTPEQMVRFRPEIIRLIREISKYFLIADLSPDMFLNYIVDRDGNFLICDGSDLYPLRQFKNGKIPRCKRVTGSSRRSGEFKYCEGKLEYSEDYKWLICEKCGRMYNPLELRPRREVENVYQILSDGSTAEEQKELEAAAIAAIRRRRCKDGSEALRRAAAEEDEPDYEDSLDNCDDAGDEGDEDYPDIDLDEEDDDDNEDEYEEDEEIDESGSRVIYVHPDEDGDDEDDEEDSEDYSEQPTRISFADLDEQLRSDVESDDDGEDDIDYETDEDDEGDPILAQLSSLNETLNAHAQDGDVDPLQLSMLQKVILDYMEAHSGVSQSPAVPEIEDDQEESDSARDGDTPVTIERTDKPMSEFRVTVNSGFNSEPTVITDVVDYLLYLKKQSIFAYSDLLQKIKAAAGDDADFIKTSYVPKGADGPYVEYSFDTDSESPAILVDVHASYDEIDWAFATTGLPVFVGLSGAGEYYRAMSAEAFKAALMPTLHRIHDDIKLATSDQDQDSVENET